MGGHLSTPYYDHVIYINQDFAEIAFILSANENEYF